MQYSTLKPNVEARLFSSLEWERRERERERKKLFNCELNWKKS
jgi:hypothetical protein